MPMCIAYFHFSAAPSEPVIRGAIADLYPVDIDAVDVKPSSMGKHLVEVTFMASTPTPFVYIDSAMLALGGRRVDFNGEPRSDELPQWAHTSWRQLGLLNRLRIRFGLSPKKVPRR